MSWLSLFVFLIMGAIIFFQTIQGTFSALIMATIAVLGGTVALGLHDMIAEDMLVGLIGDYAHPVAFAGLFTVVTIVLRVITDKVIARTVLLPGIIDKAVLLGCGIITGMIASGVIGITVQMIPWGPEILGFRRYDDQDQPKHSLWLNPDKFTVNLCGYLADNTLSSGTGKPWRWLHPDFMTELHWLRNTESTGLRLAVARDSVTLKGVYRTQELYSYKATASSRRGSSGGGQYEPFDGPPPDHLWLVVRTAIGEGGRDSDGNIRLTHTQVRLVGDHGSRPLQVPLKGIGPYDGRYITATSKPTWGGKAAEFDFVFEVPAGDAFAARFLEFKRGGRAEIDPKMMSGELEGNTPTPTAGSASSTPPSRQRPGGATNPTRPLKHDTRFSNELPMTLKRYAGTSVMMGSDGSSLREGSLVAYVDRQEVSGRPRRGDPPTHPQASELKSFQVPGGLQMLQLNIEAVHANSTLAGIVNLTRRVLQQYRVHDDRGNHYWPAGLIAEADSGGDRLMEVQFFPEGVEIKSQIRPLQQIDFKDLKDDYRFVLLFILPPNTHITSFDSGNKKIDLSDLNLTAPQ